jgi:hypothetical protein
VSEIIHIAGPAITYGAMQRQRCAWCGALIDERDFERMAVQVDASASEEVQREEARRALELRWEGLVAVDGGARWALPDPEDGRAPDRSCMRLLPDEPG